MGSLIEILGNKKKASAPPPDDTVVLPVLPVLRREHEGSCGDGCACGESEEGGCCGG